MELVAENRGGVDEPTDADLEGFYEANKRKFGAEPKLSFVQVRLDPSRRGASLEPDAAALLATLRAGDGKGVDLAALGDPSTQLPGEFT
jgi:peptidyl-prolyl cis-trans isomerase C